MNDKNLENALDEVPEEKSDIKRFVVSKLVNIVIVGIFAAVRYFLG